MPNRPFIGPYKVVEAPPATAPLHGLVPSSRDVTAREEDDRWQLGFGFIPETCMNVFAWSPQCAASGGQPGIGGNRPQADGNNDPSVLVTPFMIYTLFQCSTAGMVSRDDEGRVRRALEAGTSKALEAEFWTGSLNVGNFSLVNNAPVLPIGSTSVALEKGLATLGAALAGCGTGSRGMIHASTLVAEWWGLRAFLREEGNRLTTKVRGDIVVAGSGYPGTAPVGQTTTAGKQWVYATGLVETRVGDIEIMPDQQAWAIDRAHNRAAYYAQRLVAADSDECCLFAVQVDLP
jgi:hypothetical protein